ncbi:hypothetical protein [Mycolicibacterium gadium]|uniref:ESX-1 secretion-associated protein EspA/EspE-like domain-containing protein n=1 Tax=Mycolicibacterium gadium TaxID=1794 RepID=A0ABT6GNB9_MYCGU|nr:hypothetical protein [Mycolicibacterium gadium]MDG5483007.1 hypothetical protein [Mycolicibacterium gadium]
MIPSRSQLRTWNPDAAENGSSALSDAGLAVYRAVRNLDDGCDRMSEARAWGGPAHDAAAAMFHRATDASSKFSHYTEGVAAALSKGAVAISAARTALLNHADAVDRGELFVNDMWVVLIKPARVSAEKAADLQAAAKAEQAEINRLLTAVGDADDTTAAQIQSAAEGFGITMPSPDDPHRLFPGVGMARPADDAPNPMDLYGLMQQGVFRDNDMAQTVRESKEWVTEDGQARKTLHMMDGSRHEIYEWNESLPCVEDTYYDKYGHEVSSTFSQDKTHYDGTKFTSIRFANGTEVTMTRTADGKCTGGVTTGDGRHGVLPDQFFSHPALTTVGGALTGLEEQATRGIPMLSPQSVENLGKVGKYGGPTLGVAVALYDTVTAKTFEDACVAAISGGAAIGGGMATGAAFAGGITAAGAPQAAPALAFVGDIAGGVAFGYLGGIIGNIVCR